MTDITKLAKEMYDLKAEKDQLEERLGVLNSRYDNLSKTILPQIMDDMEQDKVSIKGVGTVYLQAEVQASIPSVESEAAIAWLKKNGHGDIVKETVHPGTLKAWTKEQISTGGKLAPQIKVHQFMKAILRRK